MVSVYRFRLAPAPQKWKINNAEETSAVTVRVEKGKSAEGLPDRPGFRADWSAESARACSLPSPGALGPPGGGDGESGSRGPPGCPPQQPADGSRALSPPLQTQGFGGSGGRLRGGAPCPPQPRAACLRAGRPTPGNVSLGVGGRVSRGEEETLEEESRRRRRRRRRKSRRRSAEAAPAPMKPGRSARKP